MDMRFGDNMCDMPSWSFLKTPYGVFLLCVFFVCFFILYCFLNKKWYADVRKGVMRNGSAKGEKIAFF